MWLPLIIVTLLAAIAQGVAGFGFTLLAVSFYLIILRSAEAVQLVIIINFAISLVLIGRLWTAVPRRLWALMAGGGLAGFPIGLWAFARADLEIIELAVAVVTIVFALAVATLEFRSAPNIGAGEEVAYRPASALAVGISAGALTSSLGMPGPPVVLYLVGLRLDKTTFRALALSTFIVMQLGSLVGQSMYVGIDPRVWTYALVLVPVSATGASIGHVLCRYVSETAFRRFVLVLLLGTGAYMLYQAMLV